MSDSFSRYARFELPNASDPWAIARDFEAMLEGVLGQLWSDSRRNYRALTDSGIRFHEPDLAQLKIRTRDYGGPLESIIVAAHVHGDTYRTIDARVWISEGRTNSAHIHLSTGLRVEADAMGYAIERTVQAYQRRKRWEGATVRLSEISSSSTVTNGVADAGRGGSTVIQARGVRPALWRWFVRNRDNLIVGLGGGLLISVAVIFAQIVGWIPTPN
ncbi:hypothetical protein ACFXP7_09315 [Microbacterium sp. P06]|uniref:hypothetical protein n=1 Tax=Microbacterium sp. P06 TaxID=3366949 RepID=UPI003744C9BC